MEVARHWRLKKQRYSLNDRPATPAQEDFGQDYSYTSTYTNGNGTGVVTLQVERVEESTAVTKMLRSLKYENFKK